MTERIKIHRNPAFFAVIILHLLLFLSCTASAEAETASLSQTAGTVQYLVIDGVVIHPDDTFLDWTGRDTAKLLRFADFLQQVKVIQLGKTTLAADQLNLLVNAFPDTKFRYFVSLGDHWYSSGIDSLDLSYLTEDNVEEAAELLRKLPSVEYVDLNGKQELSSIGMSDYELLYKARPDITFQYTFTLYGKTVSTETERLKFRKVPIPEEDLSLLQDMFSCLPALNYVCFDRCELTNEGLDRLRDSLKGKTDIVWRVYFSSFSCMTNAEKIWAIGYLTDDATDALQYCHEIRYLDLGHNAISDISFVRNMPKLEVFIIAITDVEDISPLEGCTELEYLEIYESKVTDLSPLAGLTKLKHLNLSTMPNLRDITALYGLDLERIDLRNNYGAIPQEQLEHFSELHPDCKVNLNNFTEVSDWRYDHGLLTPRYILLREQIGYDDPYGTTMLYNWQDTDDFWELENQVN